MKTKITRPGETTEKLNVRLFLKPKKSRLYENSIDCFIFVCVSKYKSGKGQGFTPSENKHEIRLSVSDGLTQGSVDILGMGLADAVTGSKRTDENYSLVYGFGYRYSLGRFKVGTDLGFSSSNSKLALAGEQAPSLKREQCEFHDSSSRRICIL